MPCQTPRAEPFSSPHRPETFRGNRWHRPWKLALGALWLLASAAAQVPSTPPPPADHETIGQVVLRDESLDQVLALLERLTGRSILRPQALPGNQITLTIKGSVTRAEAIRAIETVLSLNGIAVTDLDGKFLKVVPLSAARSESPELIDGTTLDRPPSGRIASKLFQLQFLRVAEFMPQVTPLLNPGAASQPVIFEKANAALVTDSLSTLQRIEQLLLKLDQPALAGLQPRFYSLGFAKASDVVNKLRAALSGPLQNQLGSATSYSADDRTNQIILISDPRQHPLFDELIQRFDTKADPNTRNDVLPLKHAAAKEVASLLSQLIAGQTNAARGAGQEARPPFPPAPTAGAPAAAPAPPASANAAPAATGPGPANPPTSPAAELLAGSTSQFSSVLTILPEERSNALLVSGTVDDLRLIRELVAKLDVLLAQVRIEVIIAEVTLGDNSTSGISALGLKVDGDKLVSFSGSAAGISVADATLTRPGVVGAGPLDLAATVSLATTPRKTNATILSQPNLVTTHNKEGKIFVGESRPVISSYLNDVGVGGGTSAAGYRSTVSSRDIGIDLSVKPLIGADGSVQLEIKQEVNDILGEVTIDGNPQPRIGKRSTSSFVSARSGEIIVLGGLQRASRSRSTSRLGPVPILGDLLGARTGETTRTDLVFFLRPTVLTNTPADNAPALRQLESFPRGQKEQVKAALQAPLGS